LQQILPVTTLTETKQLPDALALSPALLYVAARGTSNATAPLRGMGIGLDEDPSSWLTAEAMQLLKLEGQHVSMRTCLSGIVTQITSREALGMVWALLAAGAASLLTAAGSVDIPSARRFSRCFTRFGWRKGKAARPLIAVPAAPCAPRAARSLIPTIGRRSS
jgi:hypothetical protein